MRRLMARPCVVAALTALVAGGAAVIPAQAAYADTPTYCNEGINAGYSNGGSGSTFWGWCYAAAGQYVNFSVSIQCSNGGGGQTAYASGSGPGTIYTQSETCWFGGHVSGFGVYNDPYNCGCGSPVLRPAQATKRQIEVGAGRR